LASPGTGPINWSNRTRVLFATGARGKRAFPLPGCDLPGVYGAGAFQTLVNRDLVRCAERLFIVGGGNVGLIGAYHALQAGIDVVGLVEALPRCGGYKVHEDKIKRLGVPVWTSHTVLRIEGAEQVERVVVAAVDEKFNLCPARSAAFEVDTVLIAVGLSPVDELLKKAREYGMKTYAAGDAEEIAEASAAIFSGKITGRQIAQDIGIDLPIPANWEAFGELLKHRPGEARLLSRRQRCAGIPADQAVCRRFPVIPAPKCARKTVSPCRNRSCRAAVLRGMHRLRPLCSGLPRPGHYRGGKRL
jgi:sarcosine oxidase, subunit alpha